MGSARLGSALASASAGVAVGLRLDFGWISAGFWLRLDFGLILVWIWILIRFALISVDFGMIRVLVALTAL